MLLMAILLFEDDPAQLKPLRIAVSESGYLVNGTDIYNEIDAIGKAGTLEVSIYHDSSCIRVKLLILVGEFPLRFNSEFLNHFFW